MFAVLVFVLVFGANGIAAYGSAPVGTACTDNTDCTGPLYPYLETTECVSSECRCSDGYYGSDGETCQIVKIGSPCPGAGSDSFCNAGVANSVCHPTLSICVCPDEWVETYPAGTSFPPLKPICVQPLMSADCLSCPQLVGGVCYDSNGDDVADACGCPPCVGLNDPNAPLQFGCGTYFAYPGEPCKSSDHREIQCLYSSSFNVNPPKTACVPDGTLDMEYTCQCLEDFVQVPDPQNPTLTTCATVIKQDTDANCEVCELNEGQCYDTDDDETMDGCICTAIRSSPSSDPEDACSDLHVTIQCTSDSMNICFDQKSLYDEYVGRVITEIYAEGKESNPDCHLEPVTGEDKWCLQLLHQDTATCGVVPVESKHWKSYSIWLLVQFKQQIQSSSDLCIYGYCTYDKIAQVSTGLVDVSTQKIRYSTGVSVKPVVDINIKNKFGDDLDEIGATLGEKVQLTLSVTDTQGIYTSLAAVTCVASNMMSLNHPHAQSAVFLLDGCPEFGKIDPPPVFFADPTDPRTIESTFFGMPKFNGDIVFFHCAVKVCLTAAECAPEDCSDGSRRKRSALENRIERSTHDLMAQLESPDMMQKVVALKVRDPADSRSADTKLRAEDNILEIEERILQKMAEQADEAEETTSPASMSSSMLVAAIVGSCFVMIVIGAILVLYWTRRRTDGDVKIVA